MPLQVIQVNELQSGLVGRFQNDTWRAPGLECFLPTRRAETPLIAGLEPGKSQIRLRCAQIVSTAFREFEEIVRHARANDMHSLISRTAAAATVAVPAGERIE